MCVLRRHAFASENPLAVKCMFVGPHQFLSASREFFSYRAHTRPQCRAMVERTAYARTGNMLKSPAPGRSHSSAVIDTIDCGRFESFFFSFDALFLLHFSACPFRCFSIVRETRRAKSLDTHCGQSLLRRNELCALICERCRCCKRKRTTNARPRCSCFIARVRCGQFCGSAI